MIDERDESASSVKSHLTHCGIPGLGAVPYGLHVCHFYSSRLELLDALIPYFESGVSKNEQCIWIASAPLGITEIKIELAKFRHLEKAVSTGQLQIIDANDWYGTSVALDSDGIQRWMDEEARARAAGYQGLRITCNTGFVSRDHWSSLMEYEKVLHERVKSFRIVACCSYDLLKCEPVDILEIVSTHDAALDRRDKNWQVFSQSGGPAF